MRILIENGRDCFYQWDLNQRLIILDETLKGCQVHFSDNCDEYAKVTTTYEDNGKTVVNVPNIILQTPGNLKVWMYVYSSNEKYTRLERTFIIRERQKPSDYVYTETEILSYENLKNQIEKTLPKPDSPIVGESIVVKSLNEDGSVKETETKKILLNPEDVNAIPAPKIATVGQVVRVAEVDEGGKPIKWEAVDLPNEYTLLPMTETALGGAMADAVQEGDTQPVRIGADHKLYTAMVEEAVGEDAIEALAECEIVVPAYQDGVFYTDVNGAIYTL